MLRVTAVLMAFALFVSGVRADDIEERLRKLELEVAALRHENEQLRRDLGVEAVARQASVKMNGTAENVRLGGLVQVQGESGDRGDSRFSSSNSRVFLRRARLNVAGRFVEEFDFRTELELAGSLADTSGLRAQLTDAYLNWNRFDSANVRVGQFKTPFGFEQLYGDPRLYTIERSLVSDRLTPGRQVGAQIGGDWWFERVNYALGIFNGNGTNINFNDNNRFLTAGRLAAVPFSGRVFETPSRWSVGVNAFRSRDSNVSVAPEIGFDSTPATPAKDNIFIGRRSGFGADMQLDLGRLQVWGEVLRDTFEPESGIPSRRFSSRGGYGLAAYYVVPDKLQLVGRYEIFKPSERFPSVLARTSTFGVNYYLKQNDLKLQVDWLRGRAPDLTKEQNKIIARLQTAF